MPALAQPAQHTLHLKAAATLLFSPMQADWPRQPLPFPEGMLAFKQPGELASPHALSCRAIAGPPEVLEAVLTICAANPAPCQGSTPPEVMPCAPLSAAGTGRPRSLLGSVAPQPSSDVALLGSSASWLLTNAGSAPDSAAATAGIT